MGRRAKDKGDSGVIKDLTHAEIAALQARCGDEGPKVEKGLHFLPAFKKLCEGSLYHFAKYVLGEAKFDRTFTPHLHKQACDWLQDMKLGRRKLMMLPVVHLKTSICSNAFPLHVLIQPEENNIYFPGVAGSDARILLNGETQQKAKKNLSICTQHMVSNPILRALWKNVFWADPAKESPLWKDEAVVVKRKKIVGEPSIYAIGVGTALHGDHYDVIIPDDLATMEAAQSEIIMAKADFHRRGLMSRLDDLNYSIIVGVGTHWTANDIYTTWKRDPSVAVMIRAAIEDGKPIWPERHTIESLLALQAEEGMGSVLFSANYMNNPLSKTFTALDWGEVRIYELKGERIIFKAIEDDQRFMERTVAGAIFAGARWTRKTEIRRGMPLDRLYPNRSHPEDDTPERTKQRRLAAVMRKRDLAAEGSALWQRMEILYQREKATGD